MQFINQVYLILLAIILLGILSSTVYKVRVGGIQGEQRLWPISILCRVGAFTIWALSPMLGEYSLIASNTLFLASGFALVLFIRSWRLTPGKSVKYCLLGILLLFAMLFTYLLSLPNSLPYRFALGSGCIFLSSIWELYETSRKTRSDKSYLLKLLQAVVFLQILLSAFSMQRAFFTPVLNVPTIIHADVGSTAIIFMWVTFGVHLLSYIIINSYLYEQLWKRERQTHEALKLNQQQLNLTTKEKEEIKQLLEERESLINGLMHANKTAATGALAASIAHELGQPLAVIQMNTELLYKHAHTPEQINTIDPNEYLHILGGILKSNHLAAGIIKTLRGVFRQEKPQFQTVDLKQLLYSVVQLAKTEMDHQQVRLHIDIPDNITFDAYPNELFQVILNLLNNAIQALSTTTATDRVIRIQASQEGQHIGISISDNGPGIPTENQSKLFQLFALGSKPESMGLGLWLCHYIVNRHNGVIRYEPSESGGANFLIELPLHQNSLIPTT